MNKERQIAVTVKLVFDVNIPDTVNTPENVLAEYLVNKLSLDVKWATIKEKSVMSNK